MPRKLIILEDPSLVREVTPAEEPLEVGRAPEVGIVLNDRTVSRRHAVIRKRDREIVLEDVGSTFGTFVNGSPVRSGEPVTLKDGDVVRFGKVEMLCRFDDDPSGTSEAVRDAAFVAQANARLLVLEGECVRRLPISGPSTLIGGAPHCEVHLAERNAPPEQALLRAVSGSFRLESRCAEHPPRLNESQLSVVEPVGLDAGAVILVHKAQILFLYDFDARGLPLPDPLLDVPQRRMVKHVAEQSRLAPRHLKELRASRKALGRSLGEVLVEQGIVTPLFWRVIVSRLPLAPTRKGHWFLGRRKSP